MDYLAQVNTILQANFLLGALIGGILGNRADAIFVQTMRSISACLQRADMLDILLIQRAVRKAYLQATLAVCESCMENTSYIQRYITKDENISWLRRVSRTIGRELHQLPEMEYRSPSLVAQEQIHLLLQPVGKTAGERGEEFIAALVDEIMAEVQQRFGLPPACFVEMVKSADDSSGEKSVWFSVLCAFFVHELENNPSLNALFQGKLLYQLTENIVTIGSLNEELHRYAGVITKRLESIETQINKMAIDQITEFDELKQDLLFQILPHLALIPDIVDVQTKIIEHLEILLREQHRRPLHELFVGSEVAGRVEMLIQEYTHLFVGREEEFKKMDRFLDENPFGMLVITANAGIGKTALLANWIHTRREQGDFVAYHFFYSRFVVTRSLVNALRNLLRQLYIYYELANEKLPADEQSLRDTIYKLLENNGTHPGERLIIVLDALDEAERPFPPPFSLPLPSGIFIVVSARAEDNQSPIYLQDWIINGDRLHLTRLPRTAIAYWLRLAFEGSKLAEMANDEFFVREVEERTEGFPLYLHFLIQDLLQAENVQSILAQTPQGFSQDVKRQLKDLFSLEEFRFSPQHRKFFALLSVAEGELRRNEIKTLTGMKDGDLTKMEQSWQIGRWFRFQDEEGDTHYYFAHPLLGAAFANALRDEGEEALRELIKWCSDWPKHKSPYSFHYYAEHLRKRQEWDLLFALARDEIFAQTQRELFPDEPDLPLKTIRSALLSAAELNDAGAIAEFLISHAKQVTRTISEETPLNALRAIGNRRALDLADLYSDEHRALWLLLLAWELFREGRLDEVHKVMEALCKRDLPRLSGWESGFGAVLLVNVYEINPTDFLNLTQSLLDNDGLMTLCNNLIERGYYDAILEIDSLIEDSRKPAKIFETISEAQARMGKFSDALATALKINDEQMKVGALSIVAKEQARAGKFDEALETALKVDREWLLAWTHAQIALIQANAGEKVSARASFTKALKIARRIGIYGSKFVLSLSLQALKHAQGKCQRPVKHSQSLYKLLRRYRLNRFRRSC